MESEKFKLSLSNTSYGLIPHTGHTQNLIFTLTNNSHVRCVIMISKTYFSANFTELESAPETNMFKTNEDDIAMIENAVIKLKESVEKTYPERSVKISNFYNN